jgi:hypothetical protein
VSRPTFRTLLARTSGCQGSAEYATEEEVLAFANKVRKAGGANVLEALMPSVPGNANSCLIARALNFECSIRPFYGSPTSTGEYAYWYMEFPPRTSLEQAAKIADAVGCECVSVPVPFIDSTLYRIILPRHIGNAAHAFDERTGWPQKYNRWKSDNE